MIELLQARTDQLLIAIKGDWLTNSHSGPDGCGLGVVGLAA